MSNKILRMAIVKERVGLSKSTIYELVKKCEFPAPLRLTKTGRSSGWLESDVNDWIDSRQKGGAGRAES